MTGVDRGIETMYVRPAAASDVEVLAELGARTFRETYLPDCPEADIEAYVARRYRPGRVAEVLADPDSRYIIAEVGGSTVGFALLCRDKPPDCGVPGTRPVALAQIYVDGPYQGDGVGTALLRRSIDEARRAGHDVLWLTVWERNGRAADFYRRWGLGEIGETTFELGSQLQRDLVLALRL